MNRIDLAFERLRRENSRGLIAYLTAGDPSPDRTVELVLALERGGADIIELGVPFSDPTADGPVIQRASDRALKAGTTFVKVLEMVRELRKRRDLAVGDRDDRNTATCGEFGEFYRGTCVGEHAGGEKHVVLRRMAERVSVGSANALQQQRFFADQRHDVVELPRNGMA